MKKSLFDPKVKQELVSRLDKLAENTVPQWGIMKPEQMVHHVYMATKIAAGELKVPDRSSFFTRTVLRYFMLSGKVPSIKQMEKRPIETMEEFNMVKANIPYDDLNTERSRLKTQWEKLSSLTSFPERHPRIGKMNRDNWGQQLYAHANYHLTQFSV
jgi:hypothetical protein